MFSCLFKNVYELVNHVPKTTVFCNTLALSMFTFRTCFEYEGWHDDEGWHDYKSLSSFNTILLIFYYLIYRKLDYQRHCNLLYLDVPVMSRCPNLVCNNLADFGPFITGMEMQNGLKQA